MEEGSDERSRVKVDEQVVLEGEGWSVWSGGGGEGWCVWGGREGEGWGVRGRGLGCLG